MIAPWIFELLRRERDWHEALPKIASHLSALPDDRVRAALDLGAAFEHLEPDRYHAIIAYQNAGGRDGGRSRFLAVEIGWWQAAGRIALFDFQASHSPEALISACRALIDDGKLDAAQRLFFDQADAGVDLGIPAFDGIRAELRGRTDAWSDYTRFAETATGTAAADALIVAARLARAHGDPRWARHLEAALAADPNHQIATSMLLDIAITSEDDRLLFDVMRLRLLGLGDLEYCDAVRAIATRLLLADPQHHAGMGRRLARVALERAYASELTAIPGHLALWTLHDRAATQDGQRTELLPLILRGLDLALPDSDRTWMAALGAAICASAGNPAAARAYAAIVAEHASSHPIVRELLAEADAADASLDISNELEQLEVDAAPPPVDSLLPADFDIDLAPLTVTSDRITAQTPDPRFVDVRVMALDDDPSAPRAASVRPAPGPRATARPGPAPARQQAAPARAQPAPAPTQPRPAPTRPAGEQPPAAQSASQPAAARPAAARPAAARPAAAQPLTPGTAAPRPARPAPSQPAQPPPAAAAPAFTAVATSASPATRAAPAAVVPDNPPPSTPTSPPAAPTLPAQRTVPSPAPAASVMSPGAVVSIDEQWDVDAELLPPRRRATSIPASIAMSASARPSPGSTPPPATAPTPSRASSPAPPSTTPASVAPAPTRVPGSIIPAAALQVLKQAGSPRALPKLPAPPTAIPRAPRVALAVDLAIRHAGTITHAHTRDFSTTGFLAVTSVTFEIGTIVECDIRMPSPGELAVTTFTTRAKVVRHDPAGHGFVLIEPPRELIDAIGAHPDAAAKR